NEIGNKIALQILVNKARMISQCPLPGTGFIIDSIRILDRIQWLNIRSGWQSGCASRMKCPNWLPISWHVSDTDQCHIRRSCPCRHAVAHLHGLSGEERLMRGPWQCKPLPERGNRHPEPSSPLRQQIAWLPIPRKDRPSGAAMPESWRAPD